MLGFFVLKLLKMYFRRQVASLRTQEEVRRCYLRVLVLCHVSQKEEWSYYNKVTARDTPIKKAVVVL